MGLILDTNILLSDNLSSYKECEIILPFVVLNELDNINHSSDSSLAFKARQAIEFLNNHNNISFVDDVPDNVINENVINDEAVLQTAKSSSGTLVTMDKAMALKAKLRNIPYTLIVDDNKKNVYKGYKVVELCEEDISDFYTNMENKWELLVNEYLVIKDLFGEVIDCLRWTEDGFTPIQTTPFKSNYLGKCSPLEDDFTQKLAFDSLHSVELTTLFGKAGTGKSTLSLSYLMDRLQKNAIDKIYMVYSFETLKDNRTLGFLPGTKEEKIFGSGLGNILSSKFGDIDQTVKSLMIAGKLEIIPSADIRGVEFGSRSALYVTEAQNLNTYTMRTLLQRCKEGCKIIIEGDMLEQTDIHTPVNGMDKLIDVFKGDKSFGCVKLEQNHRSHIGDLAQKI